ncbi:hypothetical protein [Aeromonas phage 59.1]|nr:hypothetical protein [Aeromonas phage 59.1]
MKRATFKITAEGADITAAIADRFISLTLTDSAGDSADTFALSLDNRDDKIKFQKTGAELRIWIGLEGRMFDKGTYVVDEISEGLDNGDLEISGKAADMLGEGGASLKSQKTRTWEKPLTFQKLATTIASQNKYTAKIHPRCRDVSLGHVVQKAESDMNLLTRLCKKHDFMMKVANNFLMITPKGSGETADGKPLPVVDISDPSESSGRVTIQERGTFGSVTVTYFDADLQRHVTVTVKGEDDKAPPTTLKKQYRNLEEATQAAAAALNSLGRGKATMQLERPLSPAIVSPGMVKVIGHRQTANGLWLVESVTHKIGDGFSTSSLSLTTEDHEATQKQKGKKV